MKVIVAGIEGSGTEWMYRVIKTHPDCSQCVHQSYPIHWPGSPYVALNAYDGVNEAWTVMVMIRDQTCSQKSRINRKFHNIHPDHMDRLHATIEMFDDLETWRGNTVFASYEGIVAFGDRYFPLLLEQLGLHPDRFDLENFKPYDANTKYMTAQSVLGG